MQNAILYQAYGGPGFVNECRYSLLKYLQVYNLTPPAHTTLVIYTDTPDAFADFEPFFHQFSTRLLESETVKKWRGDGNFVHRVKIEMLRDFLQSFNGNVLYCDTDTYPTVPIEPIFDDLNGNAFYMHQYEGMIDKRENSSLRKWEDFLSTTSLVYNNNAVTYSRSLRMYNAGVVGLNSSHRDLLEDVLALTDAVYQKFPKHIAEQFAFSYCFQKAGTIKTANRFIAHYWNLKEFRLLLQKFFQANAEESIPNLIKKLHRLDAWAIQEEKNAFERLPFLQKLLRNVSGKGWKIAHYEKRV